MVALGWEIGAKLASPWGGTVGEEPGWSCIGPECFEDKGPGYFEFDLFLEGRLQFF